MSAILDNPVHPNADGPSEPIAWQRVGQPDLAMHWPWLKARCEQRWPLATERQIYSHLVNLMADNDSYFICNAHAVGLFTVTRLHLTPKYVEEQFCVCDDPPDSCDFAEQLYTVAGNWIRRLGIRAFHYLRLSDARNESTARRCAGALDMRTERLKIMIMEDKRGS